MPTLNKTNVVNGNIVQASDVYQIIDALSYTGNYDILISGSLAIGTGSANSSFKVYIVGNLGVLGNISGSGISGSFSGNGQNITGVISSSYSLTSSFSNSSSFSVSSSRATTSSYTISSSYSNNSTSSSYALTASYALNGGTGGGGGTLSGSGVPGRTAVWYNNSSYITASSFISESSTTVFVTTTSSFTGNSTFSDTVLVTNLVTGSRGIFNNVTASSFYQTSSNGNNVIISNGSGSFTGIVIANAFYQNSLRALKDNVKVFDENALPLLNDVSVVSFNYKKNPSNYRIGFIADDTHEYLASPDHNIMDTNNIIGLLIKGVQELIKENQDLKSRLIKIEKNIK